MTRTPPDFLKNWTKKSINFTAVPRLSQLRADCFRSWTLDPRPEWEVDWILRFISDPMVEGMEDSTDSPEHIPGREESSEDTEVPLET